MSIFCNIYLVDNINNWYCRKFQEKFQFTTPYWSMISSLLHLVGLGPRVYYTLTNFRGWGARPPWPPPQYANACSQICNWSTWCLVIPVTTPGVSPGFGRGEGQEFFFFRFGNLYVAKRHAAHGEAMRFARGVIAILYMKE